MAGWKCRTQKSCQKSSSGHHRTTLSGYIFATKACINNRKKNVLSSNMSSRLSHNMVKFGPLAAEIGLPVWDTQLISTAFASWQQSINCHSEIGRYIVDQLIIEHILLCDAVSVSCCVLSTGLPVIGAAMTTQRHVNSSEKRLCILCIALLCHFKYTALKFCLYDMQIKV